ERGGERCASAGQAAGERADGHLEQGRGFLVGHAFDQHEGHGQPLLLGQLAHGLGDRPQTGVGVVRRDRGMFAGVFRQGDFGTPAACAPVVYPGVLHDAVHPAREIGALAELLLVAQRALDHQLREVVRVVLVARQRTREAPQPRQNAHDPITDFLRDRSHAFMRMIRLDAGVSSMRVFARFNALIAALIFAGPVAAQLEVPEVQLPQHVPQGAPLGGDLINDTTRTVDVGLRRLTQARENTIGRLARENRGELDRDPAGELVVRAEVVAIDITEAALQRALAEKFVVRRTQKLEELGVQITVLQTPEDWTAKRGLKKLRELDPAGTYDYNHVYLQSGSADAVPQATAQASGNPHGRVGLIDGGVDQGHQVFQ